MNKTLYYLIVFVLTSCSNQIVLKENIVDMAKRVAQKYITKTNFSLERLKKNIQMET